MILSASRRTDIPSYHGEWLIGRLRAGYALTRNPMNLRQVHRILLSPKIVDCIVFWTKNAGPFMPFLDELDELGYRYYFQFTLTPYEADLEPGLPPKDELLEQFAALGRRLAPYTDEVVISFLDLYTRLRKTDLRACTPAEMAQLASVLGQIARSHGLTIRACSEAMDLAPYGIEPGSCIDPRRIERITGTQLTLKKAQGQRSSCGCCESIDIGAYNTCLNGCRYCYANYSDASIRRNMKQCDPAGPLLLGKLQPGEVVQDRTVISHIQTQLCLED